MDGDAVDSSRSLFDMKSDGDCTCRRCMHLSDSSDDGGVSDGAHLSAVAGNSNGGKGDGLTTALAAATENPSTKRQQRHAPSNTTMADNVAMRSSSSAGVGHFIQR